MKIAYVLRALFGRQTLDDKWQPSSLRIRLWSSCAKKQLKSERSILSANKKNEKK